MIMSNKGIKKKEVSVGKLTMKEPYTKIVEITEL